MNKASADFLEYYDRELVKMINDKYNIDYMEAFKRLVKSETYQMLEDKNLEMWDFGIPAIFDMWEAEQVTGVVQNSVYLRSED